MPVSGWNQCVKWVAPFSIAQSFMAAATASASDGSSGSPRSSVCCSERNTDLGRRWRCTAVEKTFAPYAYAPAWVRSDWPIAPPLGLHWADEMFWVRVRAIASSILLGFGSSACEGRSAACSAGVVHVAKDPRRPVRPFDRATKRPRRIFDTWTKKVRDTLGPRLRGDARIDPRRTHAQRDEGGARRRWPAPRAALLLAPAVASADSLEAYGNGALVDSVAINTLWVVIAGCFVMFMQAGFAFLEIGFSRGKNVGTVIAKILVNFSIAGDHVLGDRLRLRLRAGRHHRHRTASSCATTAIRSRPSRSWACPNATIESKWFFQFVFCAVSLAIVWGTTLERIKFGVYIIYAIVFAGVIYPIGSHWVFGGGWLQANVGMQDFAGSTAVHMIGATGALAVLLLLGPRRGKYGRDGKPRAIPGHNMPLFGLGVLILWLGWFGFNPGSTLNAQDGRFPEILLVTQMAAAAGVITAIVTAAWKTKSIDIGMAGNGAIGALVAITAPSGYVELWTAPIIGGIAGVIVPLSIYAIDKRIDDPVGALSAHGIAGIWGTLACGFFTSPRLAQYNGFGDPDGGLIYSGTLTQLWYQVRRHRRRVHVRLLALVPDLLGHQEDLRPARDRG